MLEVLGCASAKAPWRHDLRVEGDRVTGSSGILPPNMVVVPGMRVSRAVIALVMLLSAGAAFAQQGTAGLAGTIVDEQDTPLSEVALLIRNQETGTYRLSRSNPDGTYFLTGLRPGLYEIRASLPGFKQSSQSSVRLEVGRTTVVDVTLVVGAIAETVVVEAAMPLIDSMSKTVGGHVGSEEVLALPSSNRSFVGFIGLLPGIVVIPSDALGADALSVNGIDPRSNNFLLDGANNNDDFLGQRAGTQARTPIEAIQEVQVLTQQFDAEFGRATGAVVNAVTRHGTNVFRGSTFSFIQDSSLTSRDFFTRQNDLPEPDARYQQYGGTVGGPVLRDKAHFFFSLEAIRADRALTVNIPARPDLNAAATTEGRAWNTIVRFDHQLMAGQTWAIRWLRESSPQKNLLIPAAGRQATLTAAREEEDVDQTTAATQQSVLGNTRINSLRVGLTRENVTFGNPGFTGNGGRQNLLPATLQYPTFVDQQSDVANSRTNDAWAVEDTMSWFVPARGGSHDLKFGFQYEYATVQGNNQGTLNGLFEFRTSAPFDSANPSTYPERLLIRVPGAMTLSMRGHFVSAFIQDRWLVTDRLTLSLGIRYDVEVIPLREEDNAAFADPARYPVDTNNAAPRLGFTYSLDAARRSVLRGGYGIFYDKTPFELVAPIVAAGTFSSSFVALFPANGVDPGPSQGRLPTEPLLRNGPTVDRDAIAQLFPPAARSRNLATVFFDRPDRRVPRAEQVSIGYSRQIGAAMAASIDFIHARGRDQLMTRDVNPALRVDVSRTGAVSRPNPEFAAAVLEYGNLAATDYDALEMHLEKRYGRGFSARVSYTLAYSRGNTAGNGSPQVLSQFLDDLRLDANRGPTDFDRRHNLVVSGTLRVPRTGGLTVSGIARALSGLPFTLIDSTADPDRNGILFDPLPTATYSGTGPNAIAVAYKGGRNGAYGPGFFQLDLRAGYRLFTDGNRRLDVVGEIFNLSNRAAFENPVTAVLGHPAADRRLTDFLVLRSLRPGAIPRTGQIGVRFGF